MHNKWLTVLLGIGLLTDVGPAVADVVILRSGEMFQTRRAWNENGTVNYYNIFYGFWQGGLYTILIETSNFVDFMELKAEVFRRYGEGQRDGDHQEKYRWSGKGSDRLLSYDFDSDTGYLWMRSQALHEKVRMRDPDS